jgi:hypothetical protein
MSLEDALDAYLAGLWPEFSRDILEPETISRSADFREAIEAHWEELAAEQHERVKIADRNLVGHARLAAPFYREDQTAEDRVRENIPLADWWWWLDKIAEGDYPTDLLPEWVK